MSSFDSGFVTEINVALCRSIEPAEQVQERALAATAGTGDRD